jgi:hypothetical protein
MKTLGKIFIILTLIAIVLVPAVGCAGPAGPAGPSGSAGPQGPQGDPGPTRQIVVTWDPKEFWGFAYFAVVEAMPGQSIRIKGACFDPEDIVIITICKDNLPLAEAEANDCGAFEVYATLPSAPPLTYGPVSVRAWIDVDGDGILFEKGELQACWPLDIVEFVEPPWTIVR